MTKRTSAKYKIDRRLGCNLWGRPKSPYNKRNTKPGQHGVQGQRKKLSVPITINQSNDRIDIKTEFNIVLDDFKIKVPRLLFQNIAEDIDVKVESTFSKYKVQ